MTNQNKPDLNPSSPKAIEDSLIKTLEKAKKLLEKIKIQKTEKNTKENTLDPLNQIALLISNSISETELTAHVHPDSKIRSAAEKAIQKLVKFNSELYLHRKLYDAINSVSEKNLDEETKRFRKKELESFKRMGVDKSPKIRKKIRSLIAKENKLGQEFDRNIRNDVGHIFVKQEDLKNLPEDFKKSHLPDETGKIKITTQYPDTMPFLEYCENEEARKNLNLKFIGRGWPKNDKVLKELLITRKKIANLIDYKNWADYIISDKMAASSENVEKFIKKIFVLTKERQEKDFKKLIAIKQKDFPNASKINSWEIAYYDSILIKKELGYDSKEIREYFNIEKVKAGLLEATGKLFELKYKKIKPKIWHSEVESYEVYKSNKLIGIIHLDLHPRKGKYSHAACFTIRSGIKNTQYPEGALICNFSRDDMSHGEVRTFFHEFGHLVHVILSGDQNWVRFSGIATEHDFVEAPSQLLEEWAIDYETLKTFATHKTTKKPISKKLVETIRLAESVNKGIWQRRQLFFSALSLNYHTYPNPEKLNLHQKMMQEMKKYIKTSYPKETYTYANFGHLNGYSAVYYTYLWSRAIAEDLLTPFIKNGLYDKKTREKYAQYILAEGGRKDANDIIKNFLGRKWNLSAFQKWLRE